MEITKSLGASEFAAILNGDDPYAILNALKQFTRIVRNERRLALSTEGDETESDSSDDDCNDEIEVEQPPAKKFKKDEQWKEDSASYHVPFVGTSVAKSDVAEVVKGQWPTGLLRAYLIKSPLAIELTSDDMQAPEGQIHKSLLRKKHIKMSRSIQKACLRALCELVTAVIPIEKLNEEGYMDGGMPLSEGGGAVHDKFYSFLLKKRLSGIFQVLNDETGRGRGKTGVLGGCGSLVEPALYLLQSIASISVTDARLVARHLDESLNDGVLRCLLRPLPQRKDGSNNHEHKKVRSKEARAKAINLATKLVKTRDSAVNTYICTSGSKERKVSPGILYVAFREGLLLKQQGIAVAEFDDSYMEALAEMIQSFRLLIANHSRSINQKLLLDLLARDPLQNLCQLLAYAPPMTNDITFLDVLNASDSYSELKNLSYAGVEARRLLFTLLSDTSRSPFFAPAEQQHVRLLIQLLHAPNGGIQMQHFLLDCTVRTPMLLPRLFRMLKLPDPKQKFDFISTVHFVTTLIRRGPSPASCLAPKADPTGNIEDFLVTVFPIHFRRQALARALQSGNCLVVLECLKLLSSGVERFGLLKTEVLHHGKRKDDSAQALCDAMMQWLPDMQVLLKVRAKFDAFSERKDCAVINDCFHRALERFATVLPPLVQEANYDWMKLLPNQSQKFFQALPLVQRSVLRTLKLIIGVCENPSHSLLHACKTILEIMLTTKSKLIHKECREIALLLLIPSMKSRWTDSGYDASVKYECGCWIDGLTSESLVSFCKVLQTVSEDPLQTISGIGHRWTECRSLGAVEFSLFLVAAWTVAETPSPFSLLTAQVSLKALLFHRSPLVLGTFMTIFSDSEKTESKVKCPFTKALVEYSRVVCHLDCDVGSTRSAHLSKILDLLLSARGLVALSVKWLNGDSGNSTPPLLREAQASQASEDLMPLARFLIHSNVISNGNGMVAHRSWKLLYQIIPSLLSKQIPMEEKDRILEDIHLCKGYDGVLALLVTSCPYTLNLRFTQSLILDLTRSVASKTQRFEGKEDRQCLMELLLLSEIIPANHVVNAQLSLMGKLKSKERIGFIRGFIETTSTRVQTDTAYELDVIRSVFATWWTLSNPEKAKNSAAQDIVSHLALILAAMMKRDDSQSAMVVALTKEKLEADFLIRCLHSLDARTPPEGGAIQFLGSAVSKDFFRLAPCYLDELNRMDVLVKRAWESGQLDHLMMEILEQSNTVLEAGRVKVLSHYVLARTEWCLSTVVRGNQDLLDAKGILDLSCALLNFMVGVELDVSVGLFDQLSETLNMGGLRQNPGTRCLCQFAVLLLQRFDSTFDEAVVTRRSRKRLSSTLFFRCIEWLPYTHKIKEAPNDDCIDTDIVLAWLATLCDIRDFDLAVLRSINAPLIEKVFRSCLKYGITFYEKKPVTSSRSLKFVAEFVTRLSDPNTPFSSLKDHWLLIPLTDIFNMLTSHSLFAALLSTSADDQNGVKLELVRLMSCCVTRSSEGVIMGMDVWCALFASFNAGLGELDTAIRKLFYACYDVLPESESVRLPFLNEFRWKGFSEGGVDGGSGWDWFLDALDLNRIRSTISHFPLYDSAEVNLRTIEEWGDFSEEKVGIDHYSEADESSVEENTEESCGNHIVQPPNGLSPGDKWRGHGRDVRYSPAFLLPFILGALESALPQKAGEAGVAPRLRSSTNSSTEQKRCEQLVLMAQKLCDRGALSLCLASLSSKCEKVRYYALSTMSILLPACNSTEARTVVSWRGRPQLAMLLNSVQRAFLIKKANISNQQYHQMPVLSPLVSTFLARAALSICKPDDSMFVSLNRYFLKNEKDHGAFPDMNRLPGFIALFCSASDDLGQSRKERIWALQLLRDGFLDASCYRLVAACHAPELVLTAFENLRLSQASDEMKDSEYALMLDVFAKLVDFGSNRVRSHLVSRMGLISWMRSWCTSWPLSDSFPGVRSRVAFCDLLKSIVAGASRDRRLKDDTFLQEISGLVTPLILLGTSFDDPSDDGSILLICSICDALEALSTVLLQLGDGTLSFHVSPLGPPVKMCIKFLKLVATSQQMQAVVAFTSLPICFDSSNVHDAAELASMFLGSCLKEGSAFAADQLRLIAKRVMLIATQYDGALPPSSHVLKMLLAIRPQFVFSEEDNDLYTQCLKALVMNVTAADADYLVARELLK